MKRIVSISLGSSKRNHKVETELLGEKFSVERIGTDGDMEKAIKLLEELDGKVDAFGMGGIDIYLLCKDKRYIIKDALPLKNAAKKTPILDGTMLKSTLEKRAIEYIEKKDIFNLNGAKVLLAVGLDRHGMAKGFRNAGSEIIYGDAIFALGIPLKIKSYNTLYNIARVLAPIITKMPFSMLYPTGQKQETSKKSSATKFYYESDILAGDYLYLYKHMPSNMKGKMIVTNTVTAQDIEEMKNRGMEILVTTTPEFNGRSFGTNVMEAMIVAFLGKKPEDLTEDDFDKALDQLEFKPRIEYLNKKETVEE